MLEGVRVPEDVIQKCIEIRINNLDIPDEKQRHVKESREFRILLDSFNDVHENYITVIDKQDGCYKIVDGLQRYLIYKDYLHIENIQVAVLVDDIDIDEADTLRYAIKSSNRVKNLSDDLKRLDICKVFLKKHSKMSDNTRTLSNMLDISIPHLYRLIKIERLTSKDLLELCLKREISVRAAEAISALSSGMQDALYQKLIADKNLKPTEQDIKIISDADKTVAIPDETETKITGRTLGRAKRDREIIESALYYDRQKGIPIKDVKNISSKITMSNLIARQEDAVKTLENRVYRMEYEANSVDISRLENVIQRINGVIEHLTRNK